MAATRGGAAAVPRSPRVGVGFLLDCQSPRGRLLVRGQSEGRGPDQAIIPEQSQRASTPLACRAPVIAAPLADVPQRGLAARTVFVFEGGHRLGLWFPHRVLLSRFDEGSTPGGAQESSPNCICFPREATALPRPVKTSYGEWVPCCRSCFTHSALSPRLPRSQLSAHFMARTAYAPSSLRRLASGVSSIPAARSFG